MAEGVRKRINQEIVEEIEEYAGNSFTEKLLNWKRDQDSMSEIREMIEELQDQEIEVDSLSIDYDQIESIVEDTIEKAMKR